jgi:hypothetical protein
LNNPKGRRVKKQLCATRWGPPGAPGGGTPPNGAPNPPDCAQYGIDCNGAAQTAEGLAGIEAALDPLEARIIPAAGMMVSGAGVALTAAVATALAPGLFFVTIPVAVAGLGLAAEGGYYAWTGAMWVP